MAQFGDEIEVSLDEVTSRIRALADKRVSLPSASTVGNTLGPDGASSDYFKRMLAGAAGQLAESTSRIAEELGGLEQDIASNAAALVEADGEIASDVRALEGYIGAAGTAAVPTSSSDSTTDSDSIGIG